ncbi:hypothetical protein [Fibrivirga algicola]|uniref:Uncharacterized protein n=1 Tax=Fibrivirga algicola TaxID=2950420 RepID=A0ABX0QE45_9BACT|nr:hypothetical protein [Fibrivirga algicola]NID09531.1 hypothetical protein [Fibrivirga algicola]
MDSKSLLEWVKVLGAILLSWPIVGLISLLFFRNPLLKILEQFSESRIIKAKFGPVEIEREIHILSSKVEEQKSEQERQKSEIETLKFLITNFVTEAELTHLEKLSKNDPFLFDKASYFELELRRLRSFGLINNFPGKGIREMPQKGNLKDYFAITERGKEYLELRKNT